MSTAPTYWTDAEPFRFGDVDLLDTDLQSAVRSLTSAAHGGAAQGLHLCNAYTMALAMRDASYSDVLRHQGAVNLPDGTPLSWFHSLAQRRAARGPVRGPELMRATLAVPGLRHYLLGGSPEVLQELCTVIARDFPQAVLAGRHAPPFGEPTDEDMTAWATQVRRSEAQVLWIGLGTPRQDVVVACLTGRTGAVAVGVGAAFDFLSGRKAEAPALLHRTGLEWIFRLATEPRRLWRRYLVGNSVFVVHAVRQLPAARRARDDRDASGSNLRPGH